MLGIFSKFGKKDETPRTHVTGFYEAMKDIHEARCQQWYQNLAMLGGSQWAAYEPGSNILKIAAVPKHRIQATFNKLLPLAIIQRHKLLPNNPNISVRPANQESEVDKENANTAQALLRALWDKEDFQEELDEMTLWMVPATVGYLVVLWDGKDGVELQPGVWTGDATIEAASPFEIIPDYSVSRFKDMQRYLRYKVRSLDYIKEKYGKEVKAQKMDAGSMFSIKTQALMMKASVDINKALEDHAVVMDMFELPSAKYPQGFHHVCTEDEDLIESGTLDPYYILDRGQKKYCLNLFPAQMIRMAGTLIGTNSVEQATEPQCRYNDGKSKVLENARSFATLKILAPAGAIAKGAMIESPAEKIVELQDGIDPSQVKPLTPPAMPSFYLDFIAKLPAEIQDIFGIHDASTGVLPRRATSGKAIGFLVGQDDERHFDPKEDVDKAISKAFRLFLNICARGYTEERIKDIIGRDGELVSAKINGEQLRVQDVTISRDVALPKTAAERMDLGMEILGKSIGKEQIDILFAIMEAKNLEDLKAILKGNSIAEEVYVQTENWDMSKGIDRPIGAGENDPLHIKAHELILKDPNVPQDFKLTIIMPHIQKHQAAQGAKAAGAAGMPQEGGEPGEELPPDAGGQAAAPGPAAPIPGEPVVV